MNGLFSKINNMIVKKEEVSKLDEIGVDEWTNPIDKVEELDKLNNDKLDC